ncbi:hypothetical protein [Streptomyces sp. RLB3-6]|uniref:hypothetical protein n=1 Tax=Streptomyces sp. RLB3-6 TaxID=2594457 RepID=UPI00116372C7|nr:hypothetical protein [Streptomyces sp. RLB3-6]QDN87405.1 hypothetical protein FNV61_18785 [Streptomyces sp. RLB3-6]
MTAAEYRARAEKALIPGDGMRRPNANQISEAAVWADLAKSAAIEQLADVARSAAAIAQVMPENTESPEDTNV